MSETTTDTIRAILHSVVEEVDDSELGFKLRSALQLLDVIEEQYEGARETLEDAELEDDVRENLRELGYLD
jgi:ABC-type lipoprotein release transport system permease subunit